MLKPAYLYWEFACVLSMGGKRTVMSKAVIFQVWASGDDD